MNLTEHHANRASKPHQVYRVYGYDATLLYVGCTANIAQRMSHHRSSRHALARWWLKAACVTLAWYPDRRSAMIAERQAIDTEGPLYNDDGTNVQHRLRIEWLREAAVARRLREARELVAEAAR